MKILVTGGAGRLGRSLERSVREDGDSDSIFVGSRRLVDGPTVIDGLDVTDRAAVIAKVREVRPDVIVHLASIAGAACDVDLARTRAVNVDSVQWVAEAAEEAGVSRIVFASTGGIYGSDYSSPVAESGPTNITTNYAESKYLAEEILTTAAASSVDLQAVILRIFNVYGPGFDESLVSRLDRATTQLPARLMGMDHFVRDYSHVSAVVSAIRASSVVPLTDFATTLNIGSGVATTNRHLLELLHVRDSSKYLVEGDAVSYSCANVDAARRILDFSPSVPEVDLEALQLR